MSRDPFLQPAECKQMEVDESWGLAKQKIYPFPNFVEIV